MRHARKGDHFYALLHNTSSEYPIIAGMKYGVVIDPADPLAPMTSRCPLRGIGFTDKGDAEAFRTALAALIAPRVPGTVGYVKHLGNDYYVVRAPEPTA